MVPAELTAVFCGVFCSLMLVLFYLFVCFVFLCFVLESKTAPILAVLVHTNAKITVFFPALDTANNISAKE